MSDTTHRVYSVSSKLKMQMAAKRLETGIVNEWMIAKAVAEKLPELVKGLEDLGFSPAEVNGPARWSIQLETLAALKDASEQVNLPASTLLLLCLRSFCHVQAPPPQTRSPRSHKVVSKRRK